MNAVVAQDQDIDSGISFVTKADWVPNFWNYLLNLDCNDLVAELIQNDLDQGATRTVIAFEPDRIVCEGNGKSVDADGWQRLQMIQGAGHSVPAKRGKIGVKNHGLKTAFTVGDRLELLSDGRSIVQTLYANGRDRPPHPGASRQPIHDPNAPAKGCRISIRYRTAAIQPTHGEAIVLGSVSSEEIDNLFLGACRSAPEQFAGIVSPEMVPRYEIVLRHWSLGEARFRFSCTRPLKIVRRIQTFRRRCIVEGTVSSLPKGLREQAFRRLVPLKGHLRKRIADFFRRGRYFLVEVSWPIDAHGKPRTGIGRFRYPIGYPLDSQEARTGHGTNFNAPFASDNKRSGPAKNEATFTELRLACESLLVDAITVHSVPEYGPKGLNPLVPSTGREAHKDTIRSLLEALAERGGLPMLKWRAAVEVMIKGKKRLAKQRLHRIAARKRPLEKKRYRFVMPMATWSNDKIEPSLSLLCPRSEMQLDPRVNRELVGLLVEEKKFNVGDKYVTFDQDDAFSRVTDGGNDYFGAIVDLERELTHPLIARSYLDLIRLALEERKCDQSTEDALIYSLRLPDTQGRATALGELYSSAKLPSNIPGLRLPRVLHADIAKHPLFRRRKWARKKYTMAKFLEGGTLQSADEETRLLFWRWLHRHGRLIPPRDRPKLADLTIWPDDLGRLRKIADLCEPRSRRVAEVLADSIRRPHTQLRTFKLVSYGRRARISIRRVPTQDEIDRWLDKQMAGFDVGTKPNLATAKRLSRFETDLVTLLKHKPIARLLKVSQVSMPALSRDGSTQLRAELVMPSPVSERLDLPGRFMLADKRNAAALGVVWPTLSAPTATMLLAAFSEDGANFSALQSRLLHFLKVTGQDDDERSRLEKLPVIPVHDQAHAPSTLAFARPKDYWGSWKTRVPTIGLSQDSQARYLAVGVTSSVPNNSTTSRSFFTWLSRQNRSVLEMHIPCVLRHVLHRYGPAEWATSFTDTPFIPVRGRDGLQLVSLRTAKRTPVFLSDAGEKIADEAIRRDRRVRLVVDHVKQVTAPIAGPLRDLGVRSLREALKEPVKVIGAGKTDGVNEDYIDVLRALRSSAFRRTFLKRLNALDVESRLVRRDWQDRLSWIKRIQFAEKVEARHRFRGRAYSLNVSAGLDRDSGTFWIRQGQEIGSSSTYESIAQQLVFKPEARRIDLLALERTIILQVNDPSFGRPSSSDEVPRDSDLTKEDTDNDDCDDEKNSSLGEVIGGHSPFEPDPARNKPKPGPIPIKPTARSRRRSRQSGSRQNGEDRARTRKSPAIETEQIKDLKRNQYASNCQICLCDRPPNKLAPRGSYIEYEEIRRKVMDAHHVDLVAAGGARHAGNMILLCKLHHDNFGGRLTRTAITSALRTKATETTVRFDNDYELEGQSIALQIPDSGEVVKFFFSHHHAAFWLKADRDIG